MGILVFLAKPLWYAIAFAIAARVFAKDGPRGKSPVWALVLVAALVRYGAGWGVYLASSAMDRNLLDLGGLGLGILVGCGFVFWLAVARAAFRHTAWSRVLAFAFVGELLSVGIDWYAIADTKNLHIC